MPCDIATLATEAPGAPHSATTCAFSSSSYRRRVAALSLAIVSTYAYVDTILPACAVNFKMGSPDA
jgi:hypothetical protein